MGRVIRRLRSYQISGGILELNSPFVFGLRM